MSDYYSLFAWWHSRSVYGANSNSAVLPVARNKEIYTAMPSNGASDMTGDSSDSLVIFCPTILFSPVPDIPHSTHYTPSHFLPDPIIPSSSTPMAISMKPWSCGKRHEHWAHGGQPDASSWLSWFICRICRPLIQWNEKAWFLIYSVVSMAKVLSSRDCHLS